MANIKSSKKRIKVAETKRQQNKAQKSELNTFLKKFRAACKEGNKGQAVEMRDTCYSLLDKAAQDNVIHANKAAREKARIAKQFAAVDTRI